MLYICDSKGFFLSGFSEFTELNLVVEVARLRIFPGLRPENPVKNLFSLKKNLYIFHQVS